MNIYDFVQNAVIGMIVIVSALYVLRRLLPQWMRSRQQTLASMLSQPSRVLMLRKIGDFLQPGESSGGGCGSGCSSCSSCASNSETELKAESEYKTIEFQRHI